MTSTCSFPNSSRILINHIPHPSSIITSNPFNISTITSKSHLNNSSLVCCCCSSSCTTSVTTKCHRLSRHRLVRAVMSTQTGDQTSSTAPIKMKNLLFVEMGVGYDQHGQDVTAAAMRACRDAISSNSIPAFRRGSIPGVSFEQMKLQMKLGVPHSLQESLDIEKVKSVFPYGQILDVEVVDGGLICSSGVHVEEMGDKNDDCYIVNAAVYVGY